MKRRQHIYEMNVTPGRGAINRWKCGGCGVKISDFQMKDVINIVDGKKLGQVTDLELDLYQGRIDAIIVPSGGRWFGLFGAAAEIVIPWHNIIKIGTDVVLVKLDDVRFSRQEEWGDSYEFEPHRHYR